MTGTNSQLEAIVAFLSACSEGRPHAPLPRERLNDWFAAEDIETMGALYALLMDATCCNSIQPPPERATVFKFLVRYFHRCLVENPHGTWPDNRYEAGWEVARYIKYLAEEKWTERAEMVVLVDMLAEVYTTGDQAVRTCIVTAVLEHVLREDGVMAFFDHWRADDHLRHALDEGLSVPG